jgi:hypothetical protein
VGPVWNCLSTGPRRRDKAQALRVENQVLLPLCGIVWDFLSGTNHFGGRDDSR